MKRLPNRELTKEEYQYILRCERHSVSTSKFSGGESLVIPELLPHTATKVFRSKEKNYDNKLNKLIWLYQHQQKDFENPLKILSSVTYQGRFTAYDMTYNPTDDTLDRKYPSIEKQLYYYKAASKKLEDLHSLGIVYGDVRSRNILVNPNTGNTGFYDLDNIQIENRYPIDLENLSFSSFTDEDGFINEDVDRYMYNLMFLEDVESLRIDFDETIRGKYPWNHSFQVLDESVRETLLELDHATTSYQGDYLIHYVKRNKGGK